MTRCRRILTWAAVSLLVAAVACGPSASAPPAHANPSSGAPAASTTTTAVEDVRLPVRDLAADESMGGHTLERHVGRTDAELAERLRREPGISSASTYTDRATAERLVENALESAHDTVARWEHRQGRRPNLVLHYRDRSGRPIGRSLAPGQQTSAPCDRLLVVLRWDERADRFFVLTSYPEAER